MNPLNKPKGNEVEVLLSDLAAGAEYRVCSESPQVCAPVITFSAMLGGINEAEGVSQLTFSNGVEIRTARGVDVKFFRKVW